jgi:hemerythrin-like domain-containing protein
VIHGAIRRDLGRFLDALDHFPTGDRNRADRLALAWENFDDQLTYHHEGEHDTAWPALIAVGVRADLLAEMDAEHDKMAAAVHATRAAMSRLQGSGSDEDAASARLAMQQLQEVTLAHLDHEEAEIEPVYLAHEDDPAIREMGRKFARVSPARGGRFFAWVTDGASEAEMAAIRGTVPAPVLMLLSGLFGRTYRRDVAPAWRS